MMIATANTRMRGGFKPIRAAGGTDVGASTVERGRRREPRRPPGSCRRYTARHEYRATVVYDT